MSQPRKSQGGYTLSITMRGPEREAVRREAKRVGKTSSLWARLVILKELRRIENGVVSGITLSADIQNASDAQCSPRESVEGGELSAERPHRSAENA
jgi:hypothetical protein